MTSGYRFDFKSKTFVPRGLLVATSEPYGAEIFINGKLKGATNTSIFLPPNEYNVEIVKEGFTTWKKKLIILKELVTKTDAYLFLTVSDLRPLTFTGAQNPKLSPDGTRLIYSIAYDPTATSSAQEAGLWIMDLTGFLFNVTKSPKQIIQSKETKDFSNYQYSWTPDSRQILIESQNKTVLEQYLIDPNQLNSINSLVNISSTLPQSISVWEEEEQMKFELKLQKLPLEMIDVVKNKAKQIVFNEDNTKVLYTATASATLPENLIPKVLAGSMQKESRTLEVNKTYVYDISEDKNFLIPFNTPIPTNTPKATKKITGSTASLSPNPYSLTPISWLPTSRHLYWTDSSNNQDKVLACEYDGTNLTTIYSGPFIKPYVFASPGKDKLIILSKINFELNSQSNLYSISLK